MVEIKSKDGEKPKTSSAPTVDQIISDRITQVLISSSHNCEAVMYILENVTTFSCFPVIWYNLHEFKNC